MNAHVAKELVGKTLELTFTDRLGNEQTVVGVLLDVEFVPMYGTKLILDSAEISVERVLRFADLSLKNAA